MIPAIRNKVPNITLIRKVLKRLNVNPKLFIQLYAVEKVKAGLKRQGLHFKESIRFDGDIVLTVRGGR